ncbi:hypothetical protein BG006_005606 [Podila minutissima]|uniref:Phosphatidylglycerol/phosphatidylinositol transfer protein n=1 Tax=Podila minutissima TaxID=64525 RepID=A0A9P5VLZ1_9FUNG|nr:hypothetical protein BG006_005606 [Podila minutissima]
MKFIAAVAALLVATVANAQVAWSDCAPAGTADMTVSAFSVTPYPLCIGQNVCATVVGTLSTPVIAPAKLAVSGKYLGRVVYSDNQDLCAILLAAGHPCPLPVSTTSITACILVKPSAPANINVQLTVQALNGNNHILFCQAATVVAQNCA